MGRKKNQNNANSSTSMAEASNTNEEIVEQQQTQSSDLDVLMAEFDESAPGTDKTSADYYFDSYSHFGPIPDGADAVVQVEDIEQVLGEPKRVKILVQASQGVDIRPVGFDIQKDVVVLKSGDWLGPQEIGLLETVGVTMVKVYRVPTIAFLSIGDELMEPTITNLGRGQIRDSNRAMLLAAVVHQSCKIMDLGIAQDDEAELARVLDEAICGGADIILTLGGVSMGERDFVKNPARIGLS